MSFDNPFLPIVSQLEEELVNPELVKRLNTLCVENSENSSLIDELLHTLGLLIWGISAEVLVKEYHLLREDNKLCGTSREERLAFFYNCYACDKKYARSILLKYPVLQRLLKQNACNYISECIEIIEHYRDDSEVIRKSFNQHFGSILHISLSNGDTHHGKSVAIIECEYGKLVYKPHSLATDVFYSAVIAKLNEIVTNDDLHLPYLKHQRSINYGTYGWQEYVQQKDCRTLKQLHDFYARCGMHLALFYLFNTVDIHYENLIACADTPYFIDTETLIKCETSDMLTAYEGKMINNSILASNLLPSNVGDPNFDVNVSALFTGKEKSNNLKTSVLVADEELDWVYTTQYFEVADSVNELAFHKANGDPFAMKEHILKGFRVSLFAIRGNKDVFTLLINGYDYSDLRIRQVLRPTYVYSNFLSAGHCPQFLVSEEEHDALFDILMEQFELSGYGYMRVAEEIRQMRVDDVPYFYTPFDSCALYSNQKVICPNYFAVSPKNVFIQKLGSLNDDTIEYQTRFIEMSFLCQSSTDELNKWTINMDRNFSPDAPILSIHEYVSNLRRYFIHQQNNEWEIFVLPYIKGSKFIIQTCEPELYHYGGIIQLFAAYGKNYSNKSYIEMARNMILPLNTVFEKMESVGKVQYSHSVFNGIGALCYLNYNLYKITNDLYFLDTCNFISQYCCRYLDTFLDTQFPGDYLNGESGLLYLLWKIYEDSMLSNIAFTVSHTALSSISEKYYEQVTKHSDFCETYGLAHGYAGYALTLSQMYKIDRQKKYKAASVNLMKKIDSVSKDELSWCRGKFGIYLAQALQNNNLEINPTTKVFSTVYDDFIHLCNSESRTCLCHGRSGALDVMLTLQQYGIDVSSKISSNESMWKMAFYEKSWKEIKTFDTVDYQYESFMLGTSGVAYSLLRLTSDIPSVLSLDFFK